MSKKVKKRVKISKFEKLVYTLALFLHCGVSYSAFEFLGIKALWQNLQILSIIVTCVKLTKKFKSIACFK